MWVYFVIFAALILAILWGLQTIFLQSYYQGMKTREIFDTAEMITEKYGSEDFEDRLRQAVYENDISGQITSLDGQVVLVDFYLNDNAWGGDRNADIFIQTRPMLLNSPKQTIYFTLFNRVLNSKSLIYGTVFTDRNGEELILFLSSPLDPLGSTITILKDQLFYVTIIILLLAFILSFFISHRLAKPIRNITKSAKRLASGDYDVMFSNGHYSEIDQLANTLNYATRELSKVDELRRDLIANVSHDLRTPLTMVKAYAEMIRDISGDDPERREAHLKTIIDETDRLSLLVNDILDLSKLQSGTTQLEVQPFNLSETLHEILTRYDIVSERDGYQFSESIDDDIFVDADRHRIEQVIYNLINNAINYTGDDKKIAIRLHEKDHSVRFEVSDTGKGIPPEKLETIWERYYKANETHKRPVVGTGLGLSIVKGILDAHQAQYGVDSEVNAGSTFWFELKL